MVWKAGRNWSAFVELDPVAEITEVGTKEVLPDTPQPQPEPQPLPNSEHPHASERPELTETSKSSVGVEPVSQKGIVSAGEGSRENSSNTSSFSNFSFQRYITK